MVDVYNSCMIYEEDKPVADVRFPVIPCARESSQDVRIIFHGPRQNALPFKFWLQEISMESQNLRRKKKKFMRSCIPRVQVYPYQDVMMGWFEVIFPPVDVYMFIKDMKMPDSLINAPNFEGRIVCTFEEGEDDGYDTAAEDAWF